MNIKSVTPNLSPLESITKSDAKEKVRFQESTDRDANGKQEKGSEGRQHSFTDEEWEEAIEQIKKLSAVQKNNLQVVPIVEGEKRYVKILSQTGECIKRLTENDVWLSLENIDLDRPKGQLLNKLLQTFGIINREKG